MRRKCKHKVSREATTGMKRIITREENMVEKTNRTW